MPKRAEVHDVESHPALPIAQMGAFMHELREYKDQRGSHGAIDFVGSGHPPAAYALEIVILTGVRTNEVVGMTWDEIDFERRVWTVPKGRTKTGKKSRADHVVALSERAIYVLGEIRGKALSGDYVFNGVNGPLAKGTIGSFLKRSMNKDGRWKDRDGEPIHVHGFRTTFKSWATEHRFDDDLSEVALGHAIKGDMNKIYARIADRSNDLRKMMEAWAKHCDRTQVVPAANSDNVVSFASK